MSNRENLRRIAALSLVIAFGMSGAAGLANEQETGEIVTPAESAITLGVETPSGLFDNVDDKDFKYSKKVTIGANDDSVELKLPIFWNFADKLGKSVTPTIDWNGIDAKLSDDLDAYICTFSTKGTYTVTIKCDGCESSIIIAFEVVKEAKETPEETLNISYSEKASGSFNIDKKTNTCVYDVSTLKLKDGKATAEFIKFWDFTIGSDEKSVNYTITPNISPAAESSDYYSIDFDDAGEHKYTIQACDGDTLYTPVITLVFNVLPEDKPATPVYSELVIDEADIGDFSKDVASENTYKYTGEFKTDAEGKHTVDFSRFWKFAVGNVDAESVTDSAYIKENDDTYTFTAEASGEHKVTFYAKGHNDPENDAILTLVFDIAKPEEVIPEITIDDSTRGFYFDEGKDKYTYNYSSEYYDSLANPYTVDFKKFWTFTISDAEDALGYIITDNDGKVIKPIDDENAKPGAAKEYAVTFPKTGEYTLEVKALKADGTAYDAPVITLNFDIKSDVPELTIYDEKTDGFTADGTTYTYELTLDEANTAKDVEFTQFWKFDLNGEELKFNLPEGIEDTGNGYKVSFDTAGEYPYEIKAIKTAADAEAGTEAVLYDAPVLTLKFIVTEAKPEITVDLTTDETEEFTEADDKFTFIGGFEETEDDEGNCKFTAAFKPFWNFKLGEEELTPELFDADGEKVAFDKDEDGNWTLSFEPGKTYTYTVKALKDAESGDVYDTPAVTLVFEVPEHNEPVEELPTVEYNEEVLSKYFTRSKDDENTFIYNEKLEFTAGSSCTARFEPFYSFKLNSLAEGKHLLSSLKITNFECANEPDDILALTFSEEGDYNVVVASALYNEVVGADGEKTYEHIKDYDKPAVTLKFHVTKRTPAPVYPDPVFPVDPVTPAPTATPTATPAPTETPAPTDAPTDAPTSEPTVAPDVEMQVSAGGKRLNVRSGAGIGNSIIARLNDGSKVTVLLVEGDWSYIRATVNGNVIEGYVSSQYLKEISTVEPTEPANARVSTSGSALRLRSRASLNASIITRMPNGSSLKVLETVNGWCRVQFTAANGTVHEGWASSQYITVIA